MSLNDIVKNFKDVARYGRAILLYTDAEKYREIDVKTYQYLRRRCVEEYHEISNTRLKKALEEKILDYLPKKPR